MGAVPLPVQNLIDAFSRLPGIGPRTASRLAFYLLKNNEGISIQLADALIKLHENTAFCSECHNIMEAGKKICDICSSERRVQDVICVVESPMDVIALEQTDSYQGKYHVLHGLLSPIEGINPEDIRVDSLIQRIAVGGISEVIIATNPSMEGDVTASYIQQKLQPYNVRVTRLARGLPIGGELEYADHNTIIRALSGRQAM